MSRDTRPFFTLVAIALPLAATAVRAGEPTAVPQRDLRQQEILQQIDRYADGLNAEHSNSEAKEADGSDAFAQVNSVSSLTDISPTDWAFQAVRNLVERYRCIEGFPDNTFRGDRPLTRYEFAAALNKCLDRVLALVDGGTELEPEELGTVGNLQEEFQAELASLRARAGDLETRLADIEGQQFSTTTKFRGEASFAVSGVLGDERADGGDLDEITVLNARVRLFFDTSFSGKDILVTRLDALTTVPFGPGEGDDPNVTGTSMTRTAFDEGSEGTFRLGKLFYSFPIINGKSHGDEEHGDEEEEGHSHGAEGQLAAIIDAVGGEFNENFTNFNEFFSEELTGAISRFGRFNPIYYQGLEGTGASLSYKLGDFATLSAGYLAPDGNDPEQSEGLFNGSYAAMAQLAFLPGEKFQFGLTYVRSFFPEGEIVVSGETGSELANVPFGEDVATTADHFGAQFSAEIASFFTLSGWAGLTRAHAVDDGFNEEGGFVSDGDDATILNWAVTLAFPDVGPEGSLAGIIIGQPPKVTDNDGGPDDEDTAWHIEAQYRYQVNDNIAINPGIFVILNPEHDADNDTIVVGTIRTIFEF